MFRERKDKDSENLEYTRLKKGQIYFTLSWIGNSCVDLYFSIDQPGTCSTTCLSSIHQANVLFTSSALTICEKHIRQSSSLDLETTLFPTRSRNKTSMPFDETRGTRKTEEDDEEVDGKKGRRYKILLGFIMPTVSRPSETGRKHHGRSRIRHYTPFSECSVSEPIYIGSLASRCKLHGYASVRNLGCIFRI